jgi:hypothetical protein
VSVIARLDSYAGWQREDLGEMCNFGQTRSGRGPRVMELEPAKCLFSVNTLEEASSELPMRYGLRSVSHFLYLLQCSGSC